jgi:hypothetical protein
MTRLRERRRHRRPSQSRRSWWLPAAIVVIAVVVGGAFLLSRPAQPSAAEVAAVQAAKIKGDPAAPVEVEEWGDFQ